MVNQCMGVTAEVLGCCRWTSLLSIF